MRISRRSWRQCSLASTEHGRRGDGESLMVDGEFIYSALTAVSCFEKVCLTVRCSQSYPVTCHPATTRLPSYSRVHTMAHRGRWPTDSIIFESPLGGASTRRICREMSGGNVHGQLSRQPGGFAHIATSDPLCRHITSLTSESDTNFPETCGRSANPVTSWSIKVNALFDHRS